MATQTAVTKQVTAAKQTSAAKQVSRADTPRDRSTAFEDVLRHFAAVSGRSPEDVRREIVEVGGGMVITDKEAKAIFAHLEAQYHRDDLFSARDLCPSMENPERPPSGKIPLGRGGCVDPAEDTTMCDLVDIIAGKLGI